MHHRFTRNLRVSFIIKRKKRARDDASLWRQKPQVSIIIKRIKREGDDASPWQQKPQGFQYY
jgi:hypothetical protein